MSLKLIVIYGTLFHSVLPTYVVSQPTPVANIQIIKSLFTDEKNRKITSVAKYIPNKLSKFVSRCLESSLTRWI